MKKVLLINDSHSLATGYGVYGKEILSRLHATGKYELAELACSIGIEQARKLNETVGWKVYPNSVPEQDPRFNTMQSNPSNTFGRWRFEHVCLDFKPDIVMDIRDYWMLAFVNMSPFRDYFHWAIMPTVDSAPQNEAWLETFIEADSVHTYTDWGSDVLRKEGGGLINLCGVASPGVDLEMYQPTKDKGAHRANFRMESDINIIGTVMRNQKRKLYPDLFESFVNFLELCEQNGRQDLAKKTYLYIHTAYPDLGWNIPSLIKEHGLSHKVLITYLCHHCGFYFPSFFQDARTVCPSCSTALAFTPSTTRGLDRQQLANVYNLFDCYVQYAICEGFGMPMVEATACGLPLFTVDYSAMGEVGRKSDGYLLEIEKSFLELETGAYRVYPDNKYTASKLFEFLSLPKPMRLRKGFMARQSAEKHYDWDVVAKKWEAHFDSIVLKDKQGQWDVPSPIHYPAPLPENFEAYSNEEFVKFLFVDVLNKPDKQYSHHALEVLKSLSHGFRLDGKKMVPVKKEELYNNFKDMANGIAEAEKYRQNPSTVLLQDFVEVTH